MTGQKRSTWSRGFLNPNENWCKPARTNLPQRAILCIEVGHRVKSEEARFAVPGAQHCDAGVINHAEDADQFLVRQAERRRRVNRDGRCRSEDGDGALVAIEGVGAGMNALAKG